ncbi:MAG: class I SAM-dependent methyltransferase [Chloroflexia bacterium]
MTSTADAPAETGFRFDYEDPATVEGRGALRADSHDLAGLRLERCLDALADAEGRLLEIGCGAGRNLRAFAHYRPDLDLHGTDISRLALTEAERAEGPIAYRLGDALDLPYPDGSFDIVVLFDVLEHVPDVGRTVAEIARVLRPGGVFHCFVPCEGNPRTLFALLRHSKSLPIHRWKRDHIGHIQILTTGEICGILWSHGLPVTDVSFSFHLLGQIHDVVDYWRREQLAGGRARSAPARAAVRLFSRAVFYPTWRLAYYEDRARMRDGRAVGVHITATKKGTA